VNRKFTVRVPVIPGNVTLSGETSKATIK